MRISEREQIALTDCLQQTHAKHRRPYAWGHAHVRLQQARHRHLQRTRLLTGAVVRIAYLEYGLAQLDLTAVGITHGTEPVLDKDIRMAAQG
jgi:hypothetical protein